MTDRIFRRADWICGAIAAAIAMAVYAWTTAPNVTLLDSGEFIVAAQHFGVPHPTGYPLWTLLAWAFQLLPLGNAAWEIALLSGICGAFAVGLTAMLVRNTCVWMFAGEDVARLASIAAISLSLVFAFSFSMWSQAVIAEVYTLHALLVGLYLTCLYWWLRCPEKTAPIYWSVFTLTLAFSNHQLTLALAPLPLLIVLLVRRDLFWDLVVAGALCLLLAYLAFALFADSALVIKAALRLTWLVAASVGVILWIKRGRLHWRLVAFLPLTIVLGLLPYAYMPVASATNPPMNWGYTRTAEGFFYSFNRSQYHGSLSDQSLRGLRKVLGISENPTTGAAAADTTSARVETAMNAVDGSLVQRFQRWAQFFWFQLNRSFSPLCLVFFFASILGAMRCPLPARVWIYLLNLAFLLAAFLQPLLDRARTDNVTWWTQMPYHSYTNLIFGVICGIGAVVVLRALRTRLPRTAPVAWILLALPAWPLVVNVDGASQRNRWFGWQYGHDMLADLPHGSVVFGGTDPGRFVPTYMIFGESTQPASVKRDPDFDRRDLYIITQNGLADRHYLRYIRDHYTTARPRERNSFEHWLGRASAYPEAPLVLPAPADARRIAEETFTRLRREDPGIDVSTLGHSAQAEIARWIFDRNKANHAFYVEESFPMTWTYDHAIPDGLLYRINPEPLASLPRETVAADFAFWRDYIERLFANPDYFKDYDAQRSYSKLRMTGGHIYAHRKMATEAEQAFRESIALWPGNVPAIGSLTRLLWDRGEFDEPILLFEQALATDPNNLDLAQRIQLAQKRKEMQPGIIRAEQAAQAAPGSVPAFKELLTAYAQAGETNKWADVIAEARDRFGEDPDFLDLMFQVAEAREEWAEAAVVARRLAAIQPDDANAHYRLGRAEYTLNRTAEATAALARALELGGSPIRERILVDPLLNPADPAIGKLLETPATPSAPQ